MLIGLFMVAWVLILVIVAVIRSRVHAPARMLHDTPTP